MCTAVSFCSAGHYFGRNLDLERSYGESVVITPRKFPLSFRHMPDILNHFALIGMAAVYEDFPLYYEATNEKGLSIAGLNFPENAHYLPPDTQKNNIAPFELIPWILCQCETVSQARRLLKRLNLCDTPFSSVLPLTPLHFMLSDKTETVVIEPMADGLKIYDNPVHVLTNNPPFPMQLFSLNNYMQVSREVPENRFSERLPLKIYSRGMGGMGLPGDLSSSSRFVRAAFVRFNSLCPPEESESVSQFFHILKSVEQQQGCVRLEDGKYECTLYSSCCNTDSGVYYYTTYHNSRISAVNMHAENLDDSQLISYPLQTEQQIYRHN